LGLFDFAFLRIFLGRKTQNHTQARFFHDSPHRAFVGRQHAQDSSKRAAASTTLGEHAL
jgi:hypothetical protein